MEDEVFSAALWGLFDSMIGDIPKHKRGMYYEKMRYLQKIHLIVPFDFAGD